MWDDYRSEAAVCAVFPQTLFFSAQFDCFDELLFVNCRISLHILVISLNGSIFGYFWYFFSDWENHGKIHLFEKLTEIQSLSNKITR